MTLTLTLTLTPTPNPNPNQAGEQLADEVRLMMRTGQPIVLLHENDMENGGCEFGRFFSTTPQDLIAGGLYKALALAYYPGPFRRVSLTLVAKKLGAVSKSGNLPWRSSSSLNAASLEMAQVVVSRQRSSPTALRVCSHSHGLNGHSGDGGGGGGGGMEVHSEVHGEHEPSAPAIPAAATPASPTAGRESLSPGQRHAQRHASSIAPALAAATLAAATQAEAADATEAAEAAEAAEPRRRRKQSHGASTSIEGASSATRSEPDAPARSRTARSPRRRRSKHEGGGDTEEVLGVSGSAANQLTLTL